MLMDALEKRISADGQVLNDHVLLVDSFLYHQVDAELMAQIGNEFKRLTEPMKPTRIVTIESSGIAPAQMTALYMKLPLVIMKKSASKILADGILQTEVFSFTKNIAYQLTVKRGFIHPGDRVLLIDDFLATGEAAAGAVKLIEALGAQVTAIGIVIEKSFQKGRKMLDAMGYPVISLARIASMSCGCVEFVAAEEGSI